MPEIVQLPSRGISASQNPLGATRNHRITEWKETCSKMREDKAGHVEQLPISQCQVLTLMLMTAAAVVEL